MAKFVKGQSGNPNGRPAALREVVALARSLSVEGYNSLADIARNPKTPAQARVTAWVAIHDRAWGKPNQSIDLNDARILNGISDDELSAALARIRSDIAERAGETSH